MADVPTHLLRAVIRAAYEAPLPQSAQTNNNNTAATVGQDHFPALAEENLEWITKAIQHARAAVEPTKGRPVIPEMVRLFRRMRREVPADGRWVYDMVIEALKTLQESGFVPDDAEQNSSTAVAGNEPRTEGNELRTEGSM